MDKIFIKGLKCFGYHGVLEEEKKTGQDFYINCTMELDTWKAAGNDELTKTINYAAVSEYITKVVAGGSLDLIETLAEKLAKGILREFTLCQAVTLEVEKPHAPIGLPFENVSVTVHRKRHQVVIALGSNMGDTKAHMDVAVKMLDEHEDFKVGKVSSFIETKPYGGVEQDDFLNGALLGETTLEPAELLALLNDIEAKEGRERLIHWGPRTLDLDMIFYDDCVIDTESLTVPHKEMHLRDFVLIPVSELCPWYRHPVLGKTVEQLLKELEK